jgi:hypothetical protein
MMQHLVLLDWAHLLLLLYLLLMVLQQDGWAAYLQVHSTLQQTCHLLLLLMVLQEADWEASLQAHSALQQQTHHLLQTPAAAAVAAAEEQTADA